MVTSESVRYWNLHATSLSFICRAAVGYDGVALTLGQS